MKIKLKNVIKIIISLILICSMVLPSYASLSADDGSAFVTKAELDTAFADFNNRLTVFESGINSKIDSHVTLYLDRNGIWNRKDLELTSNFSLDTSKNAYKRTLSFDSSYNSYTSGYATSTGFSNPANFGQLGIAIMSVYKSTGNPSVYNKNFKPIKVLNEIPKSGLMHVVVEISCGDSYTRSGCSFYFTPGSTSISDYSHYPPLIRASLCFCEAAKEATTIDLNNPGEKGRVVFQKADWYNAATYSDTMVGASAVETGTYVLYFFVTKGNSLWQYINGSGGFNYFTAADYWGSIAQSNVSCGAGDSRLPIIVHETIGVY